VSAVRVLIRDDNELVRRGIAGLLSGEKDLEVCGEALRILNYLCQIIL
jgi:DNA-binding NarL/FixJ family response regulator